MKIFVVTPLYALSGVPLAQVKLARSLANKGHNVHLLVGHIRKGYTFTPPDGVKASVLGCLNVRRMLCPLVSCLRAEKPDVVFSAEDHLNTIVLIAAVLSGSKAKISGSSRVTPFDTYSNAPFSKRWVLKQLAHVVMRRADALTCVSKDMVAQYRQVFSFSPHVCVYNIVVDTNSRLRMQEPVEHDWLVDKSVPVLVAAGRLAPWKGFSDLIESVALLSSRRRIRLLIMGDGPLRGELQHLIEVRGLGDVVQLMGYVENPLKYFFRAEIFVLSSLVEGLPNVLVEAMMCGCTPVSTNCPTGPSEVLQEGKYGYLVPMRDPVAMSTAIEHALDNPIPKALLEEAVAPFEENRVLARHFELLGLHG
ncbi:MAG: glycosyltransferase [Candidatus Electrothrix sp. GW3-4]|uniref:glycosyltransferase n=1 Tax=Candidatus Electrothrix sp. GW3-4 TaxID=3126740 RepID=UPI0030D24505